MISEATQSDYYNTKWVEWGDISREIALKHVKDYKANLTSASQDMTIGTRLESFVLIDETDEDLKKQALKTVGSVSGLNGVNSQQVSTIDPETGLPRLSRREKRKQKREQGRMKKALAEEAILRGEVYIDPDTGLPYDL